jgi:ribosomal protein L37AE/L43A
LKTVKTEEAVSRSRFADCPVCKNHTLKLKRAAQVGRCKSCNETYKIVVVYVRAGRKQKPAVSSSDTRAETKPETKVETAPEASPSLPIPTDSSLFGTPSEKYSGLSEALFGDSHTEKSSETGSSSSQ